MRLVSLPLLMVASTCWVGSAGPGEKIVAGARRQLLEPARYDASYRRIPYPNGDVPPGVGVCTDVVVRAFRHAEYDLQRLIHEDAKRFPRAYPAIGGKPDRNIDHRRVPNLWSFLRRHGRVLDASTAAWKPGDVVWWKLDNGRDHVGIVSDRRGVSGQPTVIHNLSVVQEEDCLRRWRIFGHARFPKDR